MLREFPVDAKLNWSFIHTFWIIKWSLTEWSIPFQYRTKSRILLKFRHTQIYIAIISHHYWNLINSVSEHERIWSPLISFSALILLINNCQSVTFNEYSWKDTALPPETAASPMNTRMDRRLRSSYMTNPGHSIEPTSETSCLIQICVLSIRWFPLKQGNHNNVTSLPAMWCWRIDCRQRFFSSIS